MNQTYRSPGQSANNAVDNLASTAQDKINSAVDQTQTMAQDQYDKPTPPSGAIRCRLRASPPA